MAQWRGRVFLDDRGYFCGIREDDLPILREGAEYIMDVPAGMNTGQVLRDVIAGRFSQGGWPTRGETVEEC